MFRELNEAEKAIVQRLKKRGKLAKSWRPSDWKVEYHYDGNFTVAILKNNDGRKVGVSKRNANDPHYSAAIGEQIAFDRAVLR